MQLGWGVVSTRPPAHPPPMPRPSAYPPTLTRPPTPPPPPQVPLHTGQQRGRRLQVPGAGTDSLGHRHRRRAGGGAGRPQPALGGPRPGGAEAGGQPGDEAAPGHGWVGRSAAHACAHAAGSVQGVERALQGKERRARRTCRRSGRSRAAVPLRMCTSLRCAAAFPTGARQALKILWAPPPPLRCRHPGVCCRAATGLCQGGLAPPQGHPQREQGERSAGQRA